MEATPTIRRYGAFEGVFVPTLLTIVGVILFLREGWVVGNSGLGGAWLIIALAFAITGATGLCLSSIVSNIRIGAGGAYSIISQSLGLEVGTSIGIPLYLSQTLVVTLYVFGFREGWQFIFPDHPALLIDLAVFALLIGIASVSARLAFRVQYLILAVVVASLVAVAAAAATGSMTEPVRWWGEFPGDPDEGFMGISFWGLFAVFFPAATGIMAGVNISGELRDPRHAIPVGTMSAIGVSFLIYMAVAYWLVRSAPAGDLAGDYRIMIELSAWEPAVVAGLLGATFSSALASLVGAPRILHAIAEHGVVPRTQWLARRTAKGEPRQAMAVTAALVAAALMLRDLNVVAPVITMFFLLTYLMINLVVLVEQSLGLVSFRPLLRVPRIVSLTGVLGCLFAMLIVNAVASVAAVAVVLAVYALLARRSDGAQTRDVRSGLFIAVAEWAAKRAKRRGPVEKAWKANLLVPVAASSLLDHSFELLRAVAYPKGSVKLIGFCPTDSDLSQRVQDASAAFGRLGVFASSATVEASSFSDGVVSSVQILESAFFRPNTLFLELSADGRPTPELRRSVREACQADMGVLLYAGQAHAAPGPPQTIDVWIEGHRHDPVHGLDLGNLDLELLIALKLAENWEARINLTGLVEQESALAPAEAWLAEVKNFARLPEETLTQAVAGSLAAVMPQRRMGGLSLAALPADPDLAGAYALAESAAVPCLFVHDSGQESALV
ncbi:MAG: amino acid permease [Solirubrobacterales bacterium]